MFKIRISKISWWLSLGSIILCSNAIYAQQYGQGVKFSPELTNQLQTSSSPNAEVLGKTVEAGVNLFTGMPSVNIPLMTLNGDNLQYALGLSYHTGGIKVNEKPAWVGLGWNLDGEAQIVRKVNHVPDESYLTSDISTFQAVLNKGYYFTGSQLDRTDWLSTSFLDDAINSDLAGNAQTVDRVVLDGEPDEFMFNFAGYSGSFYRTEQGTWAVKSKHNLEIKIEEEIYTKGYNQTTGFVFLVNPTSTDPANNPKIASLFTKFTLTTPDGIKYVFGGIHNAIEFSRGILPSQYQNSPGLAVTKKTDDEAYTATAWKLTKIMAPDGEEIILDYERDKILYERDRTWVDGVRYGGASGQSYPALLNYNMTLVHPCYLSRIATKTSIAYFVRSQSVQKNYNRLPHLNAEFGESYSLVTPKNSQSGVALYETYWERPLARLLVEKDKGINYAFDFLNFPLSTNNSFKLFAQQLDSIKVFDKLSNQFTTGFKLVQSADPDIRRTLNEVYQFNFKNNEQTNKYTFEYDDVAGMKSYESAARDAWGYLSDYTSELKTAQTNQHGMLGDVDITELHYAGGQYPTYHSAFSTKGMLKKMINPLGGTTEIEYEANRYQSKIKTNLSTMLMDLETFTTAKTGSGSRVARVTKKDYFGAPEQVTRYSYTSNHQDANAPSSGILNCDLINDEVLAVNCQGGNGLLIFEYATNMYDEQIALFKGGLVTYSQVTEILPDGSYKVHNFSNNDVPQYRDELHIVYKEKNILQQQNFRLSTMEIERGNLLGTKMYSQGNKLIKEVFHIYKNDPNRKNNFIKAMAHKTTNSGASPHNLGGVGCNFYGTVLKKRLWAYKIYTYKNPLSKMIEKTYNEDGTIAFTQEKNFDYDTYGNLVLERETTSDGKVFTKATKYNSHADYSATAVSGQEALGLKNLNSLGIRNYPVEQLIYTNQQVVPPNTTDISRVLSGTLYTYRSDKPLRDNEYALELATPIEGIYHATNAPNGIRTSKINSSGTWERDNRFVLQKSYLDYTLQAFANKPKTITGKETSEALLWDYSGKYPVASFINALAADVAYTGFEGDYNGTNAEFRNGWQFSGTSFQAIAAKIGKSAILVSPSATKTISNTFINSTISLQNGRKYRLCFWAPNTNSFEYYRAYNGSLIQVLPVKTGANGLGYFETEFTASGTGAVGLLCYRLPSGGGPAYLAAVDEIALFPVGTLFKSMSYDSGTGLVLSVNDGAGHLELYEYDAFGRLIKVRDENDHLLTDHEYKIQSNY